MTSHQLARRHLFTFLFITFAFSWGFEIYIINNEGVKQFGLAGLLVLMWIPGLVSLVYRLAAKMGFADSGLRSFGSKYVGLGLFIPCLLALLTGLIAGPLGMRLFSLIEPARLAQVAPMILVTLAAGFFGALGEEIGWRGFLLPKILQAKVPHPVLISGIIWALWHLPLVVYGGYYSIDAPVLIAATYTTAIVAITFVISDLTVRSRSVWPAVFLHFSHNFFFQFFFPFLVFTESGPNISMWEIVGGDCGIVPAILYGITALVLLKSFQPKRVLTR